MTLSIGGKDYALNFGVNAFYEFYKEDSGHDLLKDPTFRLKDTGSTEMFSIVQSLIWASHQSEMYILEKPVELSKEQIVRFIKTTDMVTVTDLLWQLLACLSGVTVDELKAMEVDAEKKNQ